MVVHEGKGQLISNPGSRTSSGTIRRHWILSFDLSEKLLRFEAGAEITDPDLVVRLLIGKVSREHPVAGREIDLDFRSFGSSNRNRSVPGNRLRSGG